ncbi:ferric reductase domain-containing protein [Pseudomonas putida LS46]|nr:ferric reductase domain-containing protein [Pseudomonas putida LS46]
MKALTLPSGWKLFAALAGLTLAMTAIVLASQPDPDGLRSAIRATARSSFALFLLAFLASSLVTLLPGTSSRRILQERRYLGLAFAFSHTVHGVLIYRYAQQFPELFWAGRTLTSSLPGAQSATCSCCCSPPPRSSPPCGCWAAVPGKRCTAAACGYWLPCSACRSTNASPWAGGTRWRSP